MQTWFQFVTIIATVVGAAVWILRVLNKLDRRLERIELRVGTVEHQNRALLKAFPQVISSLLAEKPMTPEQGIRLMATALEPAPLDELLSKMQSAANPVSQGDLNRLRNYIQRLRQGDWLTADEAHDFYRLADLTTREYPSNEGSWLLFLVGGIVLGVILSGSKN